MTAGLPWREQEKTIARGLCTASVINQDIRYQRDESGEAKASAGWRALSAIISCAVGRINAVACCWLASLSRAGLSPNVPANHMSRLADLRFMFRRRGARRRPEGFDSSAEMCYRLFGVAGM